MHYLAEYKKYAVVGKSNVGNVVYLREFLIQSDAAAYSAWDVDPHTAWLMDEHTANKLIDDIKFSWVSKYIEHPSDLEVVEVAIKIVDNRRRVRNG